MLKILIKESPNEVLRGDEQNINTHTSIKLFVVLGKGTGLNRGHTDGTQFALNRS